MGCTQYTIWNMTIGQVNNMRELANLIGGEKGAELPNFSFPQILAATDNLSDRNMVGEGGFGCIYQGKLSNGLDIAIKRHKVSSLQGPQEFRSEIGTLQYLRHKNIISLLGCCVQGGEQILIYEYMPNKSLASIISDETKRKLLKWSKRLQIVKEIADGIAYLHGHTQLHIVHRNINSSNILLDHEMSAKISDFGLAILLAPNTTAELTIRGTYGYADPEYVATGIISAKADVYSFGIVLLEIICGKLIRSTVDCRTSVPLPDYARMYQRKLHKLVDPLLGATKHERAQIKECVKVALLCIRHLSESRPTMSEVASMLRAIMV